MSNKDVYTRQPRHIYARPEEPADSSTPNPRRSWAAALLPEKVKKAARRASTPETYRSHNWPPQSKAPERVVGRPPIEWTASHSRQLIRLVIETDIPISDLPRVLADKSIGFEPSLKACRTHWHKIFAATLDEQRLKYPKGKKKRLRRHLAAYKKFQKLERIRQDPIIHNGTAIEQSRLAQENTLELSPNGVPPASRIFADDTLSQSPVREAFLDDSTKGNSSTSPINCTFNATEPLLSTCTQDENGRKRPASVLSEKPSTERSASFQAKDGRTSGFKDYIKRMSITSRWSSRSSGQFLDSTLERTSLRPSHLSYVQPKAADAVTVAKAKAPPENRSYQYPDIGEVLEEDPVVSYLIWAHHVGVNDGLEFPVIAIRLEELISQGARVNGRTSRGETPLHLVARAGNVPACWVLLKNGASTSAVTNEGQSITAYVRAYKNDPNTDVGMYGHLLWCISLIECGSATLSAECPRLEMDERPPSPKRHRHERSSGLPQTMAALSEEDSQESSFHQLLANANMDSRVDRVSGEASVISPAPYTPPLQEQSDRVRQAESMLDEAASSWMDETWRQVQMQNQQRAFGLQSPNQAPSLTGGSSWQSSPGPSSYPALNARHYFSSTSDNSWAKVGTDGLPMAPSFNTGALDTQCSTRNLVPGLDQQNGERDTEVASTETPLQSTSWSLCVHGYEYNYLQGVIMLFWLSTDAR